MQPDKTLAVLTTGLVVGIITAFAVTSLAVLIFSGDLSGFVSNGIGLLLAGTLVATLICGAISSYPGTITVNQDVPAAIIAGMAAAIASRMSASATPNEIYLTVVAAIIVTSLLTGLVFIIQGYFKLGALVRFLPYPVVGGFLAGTGWLLASGGVRVMTGLPPGFEQLPALLAQEMWLRWLPGVIFAFAMLFVLKRQAHFLIMPGMVLGAVALFYLVILVLGVPVAQLGDQGWLLGPFSSEGLWRPFPPAALLSVRWSAILAQAGNIGAILVVSTITLLLNASGLELSVKQDIQFDRELQVNGLSTVASGLVGGIVSYPALSMSSLAYRIAGRTRLISVFVALVLGIILYFGPDLLSWMPRLILGGLLVYLGLSFLDEWVYQAWFKFSRLDFLIIMAILVLIASAGFLEGVGFGVLLAVGLFVINYSRINVVKHAFTGVSYRSRVTRRLTHRQVLNQKGDEIFILLLQSFIFFGTANSLLDQVRERITAAEGSRVRFVVLDFRQVTGLDSTAFLSFTKMIQLAQTHHIALVFTSQSVESALPGHDNSIPRFFTQLGQLELAEAEETVRVFPDLDQGLEWCENQLLQAEGIDPAHDQDDLRAQLKSILPADARLDGLLAYFERMSVGAGYYLMRQGDPPDDLYFIESGQVTAQLEFPDRQPVRLESMRGGRLVGEIGFYLNQPRTAAVVTESPSIIYRLSTRSLEKMEQQDPDVASAFHQGIILLLAERLTHLIKTVDALQR